MSMSKAVVLTKYGTPDVLVWSDVPIPEPGPGQVRIRIKAAGVSPSDLKIRRGDLQAVFKLPPGAVLGFEAAGVVDAVGRPSPASTRGTRSRASCSVSGGTASMRSPPHGPASRLTSAGAMRPHYHHPQKLPWAS
jgi:NADPH:quinone reductase-like Zn-dependent oxidoreductase